MGTKSKIEAIKESSRGLRGSIGQELDQATDHFTSDSAQLLKFHGIYQQDDRDVRAQRRAEGKAHSFMVRTKLPGGGELSPRRWEVLNQVADQWGNETLRITTRQDIQFHGVGKKNLRNTLRFLNEHLVTTHGACGDGNRNTVACPVSDLAPGWDFNGREWAEKIARHLAFQSGAYYEIWLDGERVPTGEPEPEPIYGRTYLPRKFKIAIALPWDNCVDVHTNDIGLIASFEEGALSGFQLLVGGGMGATHGIKETYPRLADPLAFVFPDELIEVLTGIVVLQRDFGDRSNRKHARLKYVVEEWGIERFRQELESRLGRLLLPPGPVQVQSSPLHLGWHPERTPGLWYRGLFVEHGRIKDSSSSLLKTGVLKAVQRLQLAVRLTPTQDLIFAHVPEGRRVELDRILRDHGIPDPDRVSELRRHSLACPALPTCGLALAEAERHLPFVIGELERLGFGDEAIKIRMAGCPNACSRTPVAEMSFVGRSKELYHLYVGGNAEGTRLAALYEEDVPSQELASRAARLLQAYWCHCWPGERFGDFCHRVGVEQLRAWTAATKRERAPESDAILAQGFWGGIR